MILFDRLRQKRGIQLLVAWGWKPLKFSHEILKETNHPVWFQLFFNSDFKKPLLGGETSNIFFFEFSPLFGEDEPIFTNIFQVALVNQPPTLLGDE